MNIDEAKELLKADILTEADLDALLAQERERYVKDLKAAFTEQMRAKPGTVLETVYSQVWNELTKRAQAIRAGGDGGEVIGKGFSG